jgi:hypothetical protein
VMFDVFDSASIPNGIPNVAVIPARDDFTPECMDAIDVESYMVIDLSDSHIIGFVGYVPHLDVWAYQSPESVSPVPCLNEDLRSDCGMAVRDLLSANPF